MSDPKNGNFGSLKVEAAQACTVDLPVEGGGAVPLTVTPGDVRQLADKANQTPMFHALPEGAQDFIRQQEDRVVATMPCGELQTAVDKAAANSGGGLLKTKVAPDQLRRMLGLNAP